MDSPSAPPQGTQKKGLLGKVFLVLIAGFAINMAMGAAANFADLARVLKNAGLLYVLIPFLAIIAAYIIDTLRYQLVFRPFGVRLAFRDGLYNNCIGYFFCLITPSSAGGQPFQIMHFSKLGLDSAISTNIVFSRLMENNIIQLVVVGLFAKQGIALMRETGRGSYILIAGIAATLLLAVLLFLAMLYPDSIGRLGKKMDGSRAGHWIGRISREPRWAKKLAAWSLDLRAGFRFMWGKNFGVMLVDMLLVGLVYLLWAIGLYAPLAATTGKLLPFGHFLFVFVLCMLISSSVPTPGAAGGVEAAFTLVLGAITDNIAATVSAVLLWRFGSYYLHIILGALVYMLVPVGEKKYLRRSDGLVARTAASEAATSDATDTDHNAAQGGAQSAAAGLAADTVLNETRYSKIVEKSHNPLWGLLRQSIKEDRSFLFPRILLATFGTARRIPGALLKPRGAAREGYVFATYSRWAKRVCQIAQIQLDIRGADRLDKHRVYLFASNHRSPADIPVLSMALPVEAAFVANDLFARLPVFSYWMRESGAVFVEQGNASAEMAALKTMTQRLKEGRSLILFPEGYIHQGEGLAEFKRGGLHAALMAGVPIVPVCLQGTEKVLCTGSLQIRAQQQVTVEFGEPIETGSLSREERRSIDRRVRDAMLAMQGFTA